MFLSWRHALNPFLVLLSLLVFPRGEKFQPAANWAFRRCSAMRPCDDPDRSPANVSCHWCHWCQIFAQQLSTKAYCKTQNMCMCKELQNHLFLLANSFLFTLRQHFDSLPFLLFGLNKREAKPVTLTLENPSHAADRNKKKRRCKVGLADMKLSKSPGLPYLWLCLAASKT